MGESGGCSEIGEQSGGLSGGLEMTGDPSSNGDLGEKVFGAFSSANKLAGDAGLAEALPMLVDRGLPTEGGLSGPPSGGVSDSGSNGGDSALPDDDGPGIDIGSVLKWDRSRGSCPPNSGLWVIPAMSSALPRLLLMMASNARSGELRWCSSPSGEG